MIDGDKERFGFREKSRQPQRELGGSVDNPIQGNGDDMQEDTPEERRSEQLDALTEKVASSRKKTTS